MPTEIIAGAVVPVQTLLVNVWIWWWQQAQTPPPVSSGTPAAPGATPTPSSPVPVAAESDPNWIVRFWNDYLARPIKLTDTLQVSLSSLGFGLLVLLLALVVSRTLRKLLERRLASHPHLDPGIQDTVMRLAHYFIITLGVLFAIKTAFNADLTTLAVVFTALSVGIGFGLQFIAGDLASGFILLFERPVRVGDFITVTGPDSKLTEGRVQSINLRTTQVVTNDHITAIVPNSKLVNQTLINWTHGERRSRISVPVGVSYDSDVELVTRTLLRAAEEVNYLLPEPKPSVQFLGFGASSLDFRLLIWTDRPRRYPQIKSDINYRIHRFFLEENIEIPYPQQDINLRGGALKVEAEQEQMGSQKAEG